MLPVINLMVLDDLAHDLRSSSETVAFLDAFAEMLPGRVARIGTSLQSTNVEETMTALFSLQVSSVMIGASQLHRTTTDTLTAITAGTLEDGQATTLHQWLITEAAEFTAAYTFLRHPPGPSPSN